MLISGSEDRTVKIWHSESSVTTLSKHKATVNAVALSPNNKFIASVDNNNGQIIIWHQFNNSWQELRTLQAPNNSIWSVAFSPNGQILATTGEDSKIILWNLDYILQLDLLKCACNWAGNYLRYSSELDKSDLRLCF